MRDEFDEKRNRESREYFSMSDAQYEARGMPPSFKEHGYAQPRQEYYAPLPRANLILVREHLQSAMHASPNAEAQKYIVLAIKEIER